MFEQSLFLPTATNKRWTFAASLMLQSTVLGALLLAPLIYTDQISRVLLRNQIFAPAPPPPPPAPVVARTDAQPQRTLRPRRPILMDFLAARAPRPIPDMVKFFETTPAPACAACVSGSTGSSPSQGVFGHGMREVAPPPPPLPPVEKKPEAPKQMRLSEGVMAAKLVRRVMPVYPALARQARIAGTVKLVGVISRDGTIQQLQVLSGHPLLVSAAVEAVKQWVYRPTLLNGEPVEVIAPIDVNFTLSN